MVIQLMEHRVLTLHSGIWFGCSSLDVERLQTHTLLVECFEPQAVTLVTICFFIGVDVFV